MLGPLSVTIRSPASLELVAALELVAQLPDLPLTPDCVSVCCALEVLLQLYALAKVRFRFGTDIIAIITTTAGRINESLFNYVVSTTRTI